MTVPSREDSYETPAGNGGTISRRKQMVLRIRF